MTMHVQTGTYRREYGNGHQYFIDGQKVPGVTTILGNGFPKPGLVKWAGETVANYAVDNWRALSKLPISQRQKKLAHAPYDDRDGAGRLGTKVHTLAERLSNGESVSVPEEVVGRIESYQRFLEEWEIEVISAELPVFNRKNMYGGTADLFGIGRGIRTLFDVKTNRSGPFGDIAFQLAGYRYAEFTVTSEGAEIPIPQVSECKVVWVKEDGYEVIPFTVNRRVFAQFLSIKETAEASEESRYYKGDPE